MTTAREEFLEQARQMLVHDEGKRLRVYDDTLGVPSIGVGRNLIAMGLSHAEIAKLRATGIDDATAHRWLDEDIARAVTGCLDLFGEGRWAVWSVNRRLGWVNFVFNLGVRRASTFRRALLAVVKDDWGRVRTELENSLWATQVKRRAERVIGAVCEEIWTYDIN